MGLKTRGPKRTSADMGGHPRPPNGLTRPQTDLQRTPTATIRTVSLSREVRPEVETAGYMRHLRSSVTKCCQRIDTGRSPSWEVAGGKRHKG